MIESTVQSALSAQLALLPKIELHRHLEGSVRLRTLVDVAKDYHIDLPTYSVEGLRQHVQVTAADANDAAHFMKKFSMLRKFFCSPDVIRRVAREAVADAAADNVKYMELRFTPKALAKLMNYSFDEVTQWVCDGVSTAQEEFDIKVRLIVSLNRHESVEDGERSLRAAVQHMKDGVVGLDLCGHEAGYPAKPFYGIFREARQEGLGITIHAGEWAGPGNIRDAVAQIGAQRIGHGVRVVEDHSLIQLALEQGTTFEVCLTSNIQSGVVYAPEHHPLVDMNYLGLRTTINTDDPAISNITLTDEFILGAERLGMGLVDLKRAVLRSAESSFLPAAEKTLLIQEFTERFTEEFDVSNR